METTPTLGHERMQDLVDEELSRRVEELSREVGMNPRELVREAVEEFAALRKPRQARASTSALGQRLRAIRAKIVRSGIPLVDIEDVDRELADSRRERNG